MKIKFLEFPEIAIVIAIRGGEQIGARIEGDLLTREAVRQRNADVPAGVVVLQPVLGQGEQGATFEYPGVAILIYFI